jgi:hypothetical protein
MDAPLFPETSLASATSRTPSPDDPMEAQRWVDEQLAALTAAMADAAARTPTADQVQRAGSTFGRMMQDGQLRPPAMIGGRSALVG